MTKTQRRINKRNLIRNSRRYRVVTGEGNGHYFPVGTIVRHADAEHYADVGGSESENNFLVIETGKVRFPLKQWVGPRDIV